MPNKSDFDLNLSSASPVVRSLCNNCGDRGKCCRKIRLNWNLNGAETKLEAFIALASAWGDGEHTVGLPFIPEYKDENKGWVLSCINLTEDGKCGDYDNRPNLCHIFIPGYHHPCAMTMWWDSDWL